MRDKIITSVYLDRGLKAEFKKRKMNLSGFINEAGWQQVKEFDEFSEYRKRRRV